MKSASVVLPLSILHLMSSTKLGTASLVQKVIFAYDIAFF